MFVDEDEAPAVRLCSVSTVLEGTCCRMPKEDDSWNARESSQVRCCWPWRQADDILSCIIQDV